MKIVFDHQIFYSQRYGGISRYFRELSLHLARAADTRVAVVATFHINAYLRRKQARVLLSSSFTKPLLRRT